MAHNLEIVNGVASFVENGKKERAWHGLGQVFDGPLTVKEALELSHADYRVELHPILAMTPTFQESMQQGTVITEQMQDQMLDSLIPGKKVTMRMDTMKPLGVVSDSYGAMLWSIPNMCWIAPLAASVYVPTGLFDCDCVVSPAALASP